MADLRIRVDGVRPPFAPRARWVLETLADALGATPRWTDGEADLVYAPEAPESGVWIPADPAAQAFFESTDAFPAQATHDARGLTLLFPPTHPDREIPGDLVASAFYLLARWDELHVAERDALRPPSPRVQRLRPHRRARPRGARGGGLHRRAARLLSASPRRPPGASPSPTTSTASGAGRPRASRASPGGAVRAGWVAP